MFAELLFGQDIAVGTGYSVGTETSKVSVFIMYILVGKIDNKQLDE